LLISIVLNMRKTTKALLGLTGLALLVFGGNELNKKHDLVEKIRNYRAGRGGMRIVYWNVTPDKPYEESEASSITKAKRERFLYCIFTRESC